MKTVELKTKTLNGVTYDTVGVLGDNASELTGALSCKYLVSGASMKTMLTTNGALSHETTLENTGVDGLKVTVLGGVGPKQTLVVTGEYCHPHFSALVAANCIGKPSVTTSIAVGMHGLTAGLQTTFDVEKKEMGKINGLVNYSNGKEHEATLQLLDKAKKAKFCYSHIVKPDFSVAAEFDYDTSDESKVLTMGTKYSIDPETTLKSKLDSTGSVWLSYSQEIRKSTTLTLCTKFDARNMDKPSQQFGLTLAIE